MGEPRQCLSHPCTTMFYPRRGGKPQIYCSATCKSRALSTIFYRRRPERARELARAAYHKHREERLAQVKEYQATHKDKIRLKNIIYRLTHLEKVKELNINHGNKRRDQKAMAGLDSLTVTQWKDLIAQYNSSCAYCGVKTKLTQDHVIPLAKGGRHTKDNVVPACMPCNTKKGTKTLEEFRLALSKTL